MKKHRLYTAILLIAAGLLTITAACVHPEKCGSNGISTDSLASITEQTTVITGAEQPEVYLPLMEGKKAGMLGNQTSVAGEQHLVDLLLARGVDLRFAFAPEPAFRGQIDRGEQVSHVVAEKTRPQEHKTELQSLMREQ